MEEVEERKMGWWEETGKEKERGAGQLDISWVYFGLIIAYNHKSIYRCHHRITDTSHWRIVLTKTVSL